MPPFPLVLLKEEIPDEPVREVIPDMPEASAKSQKKSNMRKSKKKKQVKDKTNLINSEQSPLLNAVESNQRMPKDDHLVTQMKPTADASQEVPVFEEEHDVGSGVQFEAEKEEDKEKLVEENLNADEEEEDKNEAVKEVEHEEQAAGIRVVGEVIPPDAGLAMTDKDTAVGEIASDIAPLRTKKRTKRGKAVKQASADVSTSVVPEPTALAQEKNDQNNECNTPIF
ncbi:hypothetical protein A2U01_0023746, partial [Trifolium medium]|nr:hypothetical protein [Trifolium medium]